MLWVAPVRGLLAESDKGNTEKPQRIQLTVILRSVATKNPFRWKKALDCRGLFAALRVTHKIRYASDTFRQSLLSLTWS